jgi:dephospho-CoA kinase
MNGCAGLRKLDGTWPGPPGYARPVHVFGLTGGFATGKSTVVARFRARGVPVVEADVLAREVVQPGSEGLERVVEAFGRDVLDANGALDRKRLAERVFSDRSARERLESLLHPLIRALQKTRMAEIAARGELLACYEAPLLVEVGLASELRPLVVVGSDEATQIERARRRDGLDETAARARIRAQMPLAEKRALADYFIENEGTLEELIAETDRVLDAVCETTRVPPERYPRPPIER